MIVPFVNFVSWFAVRSEHDLDITETCSCVSIDNKTDFNFPRLNLLSLFKCKCYTGGNILNLNTKIHECISPLVLS